MPSATESLQDSSMTLLDLSDYVEEKQVRVPHEMTNPGR